MRSTRTWVFVAALVSLTVIAEARPGYGDLPSNCGSPISVVPSAPQIVTYGDPCFCKESLPYSIQVPQVPSDPVEKLRTYGYSITEQPRQSCTRLRVPVKIQTPIIQKPCDNLCGSTYGVTVQHQPRSNPKPLYTFDAAVKTAVTVEKPACKPCLSVSFQNPVEQNPWLLGKLPIAVETPAQGPPVKMLTGLTATVDRVLVPACECGGCPDCNDVRFRNGLQ
ncbi:uncharacterized protein LOC124177188 [Neodiprion fabricii]|uniref:uncharacterized protein LOC124177188 n=1 Tax=Neodiprion fabricii TaxID=2872261 RepID=UPI001ED94E68|nr:uncharacterized protein LOC124177188 [Neodiprion fabricii]